LRYPTIRRTTLGIADHTRIPRAATSDRPDTMGGSCLVPVMHWTSARRACGGVCAPLQLRRSDTGFTLAGSNVQRSMRRCAVKLLFWHSPCYACTHPGRTILLCVLDGQTTDAFHFLHALPCCLFRSPPVVLRTVDTDVLCPSHFRTHRTVCLSQHPVNDTWVLRITVAWSLCVRTILHQDLFLCVLRRAMFFAPGHIERTPRPAWVAPSYGLRLTSICVLRSVFAIVVCGRAHRCMPVKSHAHHSAVGDSEPGPDSETLVSLRAQ
jgi:hypothetical protein